MSCTALCQLGLRCRHTPQHSLLCSQSTPLCPVCLCTAWEDQWQLPLVYQGRPSAAEDNSWTRTLAGLGCVKAAVSPGWRMVAYRSEKVQYDLRCFLQAFHKKFMQYSARTGASVQRLSNNIPPTVLGCALRTTCSHPSDSGQHLEHGS